MEVNQKTIASKGAEHARLAAEAWRANNMADYAIESTRFELALRYGRRMDREAARIYTFLVNDVERLVLC